ATDLGERPAGLRRGRGFRRRHGAACANRGGSLVTAVQVPTDIAIAQAARLRPLADIAAELGLDEDEVELYGKYKAKVLLKALAPREPKGGPRPGPATTPPHHGER